VRAPEGAIVSQSPDIKIVTRRRREERNKRYWLAAAEAVEKEWEWDRSIVVLV
jgi:hypothetical protein